MWRDDAASNNFQWYWFCGFWSRRPCCDRCCPPNFTGKPLSFFPTFTSYLSVPQIGFCCAYLIFISENLETYIPVSWIIFILTLSSLNLCILKTNMQNAYAKLIHELSTFVYIAVSREDLMAVSPHSLSLSSHACQGYQPVCCIQVCTPLFLFL